MKHEIATNQALIFGVYFPGQPTLAQVLDDWNMDESSANDFIGRHLQPFYRTTRDVGKSMPVVYAVYQDNGHFIKYAIQDDCTEGRVCDKIELGDYHPLQQWILKFQEAVEARGLIEAEALMQGQTPLDLTAIRNTARELFNKALRMYQKPQKNEFIAIRHQLINFFSDPVCLYGSLLGAIIQDTQEKVFISPINRPEEGPVIDLPLLLPIVQESTAQNSEPLLLEQKATPSTALVTGNPPSASGQVLSVQQIEYFPGRMAAAQSLVKTGKPDIRFLQSLESQFSVDRLKQDKAAFLRFCFADHKLLQHDELLYAVLIESSRYVENHFGYDEQGRQNWVADMSQKICYLLKMELQAVGSLVSNVEGLKTIAAAVPKGCSNTPKMLIPNCSLSDLYASGARREKFEKLLIALNGPGSSVSDRMGIAILPKVSAGFEPDDQNQDDTWGEQPASPLVDGLGDETLRSHFIRFLNTVEQEQLHLLTFISLTTPVSANKLVSRYFEDADEGYNQFMLEMQRRTRATPEILKQAALCLPDKLIFNECRVQLTADCGGELTLPPLMLKAAFQVAALAIRNDSPEVLRKLLPAQQNAIKEQPGMAIGPDIRISNQLIADKFPALMMLNECTSDMNIDADILQKVDRQGCYCFLQHLKGNPVQLRTFNTLYRQPVNAVRATAYLELLRTECKHPVAELQKLCSRESGKGYLNAIQPENYELEVTADSLMIVRP